MAIILCLPLRAQFLEPIQTKTAIPLPPGMVSLKLDYAGPLGQTIGSEIIPEATLEAGVGSGWEALLRYPLLRVPRSNSNVIGGGQFAIGARRLVTRGEAYRYAVSLEAIVETPTGDTRLVGSATQIMSLLLADWYPVNGLVVYSNIVFDHTIGGTTPASFLEFAAVARMRPVRRLSPAVEFIGSHNFISSRNESVALPEVIFSATRRLEAKAGVQFGLNSATPALGLRLQLAWYWGGQKSAR